MAWRLNDFVVRGEVDNREKGRVTGQIWLAGRDDPLRLELLGNPLPDLAGCLLQFTNPHPVEGDHAKDLFEDQIGQTGTMTASRKVRVPDDMDAFHRYRHNLEIEPPTFHIGNSLYIEWFSERNGRVVIEGSYFKTTISEPAWIWTPADAEPEEDADEDASAPFALEVTNDDDDRPMSEFEWEQHFRESDAMSEKFAALLDKYVDHPERDRIVAREMGWTWLEEALEEEDQLGAQPPTADTPFELGIENEFDDDEDDESDYLDWPDDPLEPNPTTEGKDWVRDDNGHIHHPLTMHSREIGTTLWNRCRELGLIRDDGSDYRIIDMLSEHLTASAKLAGALNTLAYETRVYEPGFIVAALKRALNYLHQSMAHAETVSQQNLLPTEEIRAFRNAQFDIRERILALMQKYRAMLNE